MFKPKIKLLTSKKANTINVMQIHDSVVVEVLRGKNQLKFDLVTNYFNSIKEDSNYFVDLLFSYKNQLIYTVTDENYWCPTCERMIRKHYTNSTNHEIKEIMDAYRTTMMDEKASFNQLIDANYPIFNLLPTGKYMLSLRNIFPTFGENKVFSDFTDKIVTASTDTFYRYLGGYNGHISVDASTCYMLPTQLNSAYSEDTLQAYREKNFLGRGLVTNLSGFLGCLLDGHHKAKIAYERNQALECIVIEPYTENTVYKGFINKENSLNFNKIPTIDEFCYIQNFTKINDITNIEDLKQLIKKIVEDGSYFEDMEQLVVTLYVFCPLLLIDLYSAILDNYLYKSVRFRYFEYITTLERTEIIEKLLLDFLINDDYENKPLTKLCEDYFR